MSRTSLEQLLSLTSPPVAVAFVDAAPAGVPHVSVVEAASCGYWRRAAAGKALVPVGTLPAAPATLPLPVREPQADDQRAAG